MRKKIISTVAVSCLLLSSLTHASESSDKPEGWYVKGSWENMFLNDAYEDLSFSTKDPMFGAGVGYKKGMLRGELQYRHLGLRDHQVRASLNTIGATAYLDLDNSTIFSPYVGLGIEGAFLKAEDRRNHDSFSYNETVGTAAVGVRTYVSQSLALDLGYRSNIQHMSDGGVGSLGLVYSF